MTGLDVDELKAGVAAQPRRRNEIVHQPIELVVLTGRERRSETGDRAPD